MRPYIHLYLALLLPISLLIALLLIFYFTIDYNFTQSITLGILYGLFTGVFVTLIVVIAISILRKSQKNIQSELNVTKNEKETDEENAQIQSISSQDQNSKKHVNKGMDHKLMLLMNKELTFEIILASLKNQSTHSLTTQNFDKGSIDIKTQDGIISISIISLTKHTSQVTINELNNSKYIQNIVSSLKEKEHSFLQY